MRLRRRTSISR
ncbi:phage tail tape measure protein, lambda family, partial [Escherichia coli 10.0869]